MKKELSDIEKVLFVLWVFLGGLTGAAFIAPIYQQSPPVLGFIGLIVGAGIGYAFFRKPDKRKQKRTSSQSAWISDVFADILMKRIYRAYNVREEPDEDSENGIVKQGYIDIETKPLEGLHATLDNQPGLGFWQSLSPTSKFLTVVGVLWPVIFAIIYYLFPNLFELVKKPVIIRGLFLLPTCFMAGLIGMVILFQQNAVDNLEEQPGGNLGYLVGILAILLGCGLGAYFVFVDLIGVQL